PIDLARSLPRHLRRDQPQPSVEVVPVRFELPQRLEIVLQEHQPQIAQDIVDLVILQWPNLRRGVPYRSAQRIFVPSDELPPRSLVPSQDGAQQLHFRIPHARHDSLPHFALPTSLMRGSDTRFPVGVTEIARAARDSVGISQSLDRIPPKPVGVSPNHPPHFAESPAKPRPILQNPATRDSRSADVAAEDHWTRLTLPKMIANFVGINTQRTHGVAQ